LDPRLFAIEDYNSIVDTITLTISDARKLLERGELSPQALMQACFHQIEQLNPKLNAFITISDQSRSAASLPLHPSGATSRGLRNNDSSRQSTAHEDTPSGASNAHPPLSHIPLAIKDLIETSGIRTTAGSKFFSDYIPDRDAFVIEMLKQAGAVIVGKTHTHEIALGMTSNNPHFGACRNPWDLSRIPGGSSGGSAVAVATGMALGALGTDTGGSIRIPASLCGVVGLKPTYGRVSLRGVFPLSWNLDHLGPLTKSVEDAALLLELIAKYDPQDPACINIMPGDYLGHLNGGLKDRKLALAVGDYIEDCDREVTNAVREAARVFKELGARVMEVELPFLQEAAQANTLITQADAAAYHSQRLIDHPDWFGTDVHQRLETGAAYSSTDYVLARRTQVEIRRRCEQFFETHDLLILPTTPIPAPPIEGLDAVEQARSLTRFTAPFNLTGLPALSLPCGYTTHGLPIGLQLVARPWGEVKVLQAGHTFERSAGWHSRMPEL
jgi:aspartyl-tRNA(Asn)/glutamyl-tRNA(Gln) amidotransferase subunit A